MGAENSLTNLQLELLKMFKYELSKTQLEEVKELLSNYFAGKASDEMDKLWEENDWSNETMDEWANEHLRTKYK